VLNSVELERSRYVGFEVRIIGLHKKTSPY
jgi:hypothetical protein